jgi:hypothetical protein
LFKLRLPAFAAPRGKGEGKSVHCDSNFFFSEEPLLRFYLSLFFLRLQKQCFRTFSVWAIFLPADTNWSVDTGTLLWITHRPAKSRGFISAVSDLGGRRYRRFCAAVPHLHGVPIFARDPLLFSQNTVDIWHHNFHVPELQIFLFFYLEVGGCNTVNSWPGAAAIFSCSGAAGCNIFLLRSWRV